MSFVAPFVVSLRRMHGDDFGFSLAFLSHGLCLMQLYTGVLG